MHKILIYLHIRHLLKSSKFFEHYPAHLQEVYVVIVCRVSQEECARIREGIPYVKVYRCNTKHLCPKLNCYGDNGQRKMWSSGGSKHCTCQLTSLINVCPWVWCPMTESHCILLHCILVQLWSMLIPECAVSHVTSVLAMHASCIVHGTLRTNMTCVLVSL
jgi:hypothetical protein